MQIDMMPLDVLPEWALSACTLAVILLMIEAGYRGGRRRHLGKTSEKEAPVGGMVAAGLGLLAFLLAFTFGIAASRYDTRRQLLLEEANGIGTTYLRAQMLPQPQRDEARRFLREYVDIRLAAVKEGSLSDKIHRSEQLHGMLWAQAVAASEKDPRSVSTGLFVQSLNDVIDLHAKRVNAVLRSRIPTPVWAVLFVVAVLSFAAMGYHAGLTGTTRSPAVLVVAMTFATVIWLVANLDRPGHSIIRVNQQPMIELRNSMAEAGN